MRRVFKNKPFARFAAQEKIADAALCAAIARAERGLVDADLGGGVIKQRIARPGQGRSGGFRSIVLFCLRRRAFFVHGFAKNARKNITDAELRDFRDLAQIYLKLDAEELEHALQNGVLIEVICDEDEENV